MKEVVKEWGVEVYSDSLKHNRVWKVRAGLNNAIGSFIFNGEELESYGVVSGDQFYLKHFGFELKGKVVEGKKFIVKRRKLEFEIEVKKGRFTLELDYIPCGIRLTPVIYVRTSNNGGCAILPDFLKIYVGKHVWVESISGGLLVKQLMGGDLMLRAYTLTEDGEHLVYEGSADEYEALYTPKFSKVGENVIVELREVDEKVRKYFVKAPELSYLFVRFNNSYAWLSFDLENWVKVRAGEMVFKRENELRREYNSSSSDLDELLLKCFERTSEAKAQELYKVFTEKIQAALEGLNAYIAEKCDEPNRERKNIYNRLSFSSNPPSIFL